MFHVKQSERGKEMNTRYVTCADTAKEIRKALKTHFPDSKFSVRSHVYSGGASIRIYIESGNCDFHEVQAVGNFFAGATFDGMTDYKDYRTSEFNGETVYWGADFVFTNDEREAA